MKIRYQAFLLFFLVSGVSRPATLVLKRAWVEQFKDRATIDASFTIDHAHPKPNAPAKDGDMHVAGRAPKEIGLPMVAEMMNAAGANVQNAVKMIHANEGNGKFLSVAGAWRVWFEHPPSSGSQIQFAEVNPAGNTNPDHCFEIHPLTKIGDIDVTASFHDIKGFEAKDAQTAFGAYERLSLTIAATKTAVTLESSKVGFNYVLFTMHITDMRTTLKDGGFAVTADILPEAGEEDDAIANNVRMIFVPGTEPWKKAQAGLQASDEMEVLGIPRVNLNAVSSFLAKAADSTFKRKLPYEMIIVALEGKKK